MKNFTQILFLLLTCLSFNCERNSSENKININQIDKLFINAKNINLSNQTRLIFADSIYYILKNNDFDSITKIKYPDLIEVYQKLNDDVKFLKTCKELIIKSKKDKNYLLQGNTEFNLGNHFYSKIQIDSAYLHLTKAEKIFRLNNDNLSSGYVLISKSNIQWINRNYIDSENLGVQCLKIAEKNKDFNLVYNANLTIGNSLTGLKNYQKAIAYYNKAIVATENLKKETYYTSLKVFPYLYIGTIYQKQNLHQKAIHTFSEALLFDNFLKTDKRIYCYLTNALNYSKFKLGDKTVQAKFLETLQIGKDIESIPIQITSKHFLGEYYLAQKDTANACGYLEDAQQQAHKNKIFEDELEIIQLLAKANPTKESFYNRKYIHLQDSLQNVERNARDKFARIEYETDQINQEKIVAETEKNKISTQFIYFAALSGLLLFLFGLVLYNKNKSNKLEKLLYKQQQELNDTQIYSLLQANQQKIEEGKRSEKQRISRDLHDGVMGKLAGIRMNLYEIKHNQSTETIENHLRHINQLKLVEEEIRNLTHELNSNVYSDSINFESMLKTLFEEIITVSKTQFVLESDSRINWELVSSSIKINLYRVFQEAFQNINKYAEASMVKVSVSKNEAGISIQIVDNGKGFKINKLKPHTGIGLKNMAHRINELGGELSIDSKPNDGTKINLTIPV